MKILIISPNFPPLNSIASLRPYSWARCWTSLGHNVTILTTQKPPSPQALTCDLSAFTMLEQPIPGYNLFRHLDDRSAGPKTARVARERGLKKLTHALNRLRRARGIFIGARMPDHHDLWILPAIRRVRKKKWDLLVSSHGPYASHLVALHLKKKRPETPWVADFRDLWTQNHIFPGVFPFTQLERYLEARIVRNADVLTTVSAPLAQKLRRQYARKAFAIENGVDLEQLDALPSASVFPQDGLLRIVYTGTIYQGKQDPSPLFQALAQLEQEGFPYAQRFRVIFAGKNLGPVLETARSFGIERAVEFAGFVTHDHSLMMQRDADAVLFLEFEAPGYDGILTGKLFEYLASGTPILSVGTQPSSSAGALIEEAEAGEACGRDLSRIKSVLVSLVEGERIVSRGREFVRERYDRNLLANRVLDVALSGNSQ